MKRFQESAGDCQIVVITQRHLETYLSTSFAKVTRVMANVETRSLKAAFNLAVKLQLLEKNPFAGARQLRIGMPEKVLPFLATE